MKKPAIILYGPPGSGKGTQANLLASKLNLIHFDTGKFLEAVVYDPARQREPHIKIGREHIFIFEFTLPAAYSIKRNSARLVCKDCGYMLLTAYYPKVKAKYCPVCGGGLYRRSLDNPKVIRVRLGE